MNNKATTKATTMNGITATELMATDFGKPTSVVEGVLPEGLAILGGHKGEGKSFMALDAAIAVAEGSLLWGAFQATQGEVLFLGMEDTMPRIKRRLSLRGGNIPGQIEFFTAEHNFPRLDDGGLEALEDLIHRKRPAKLIVLDTLGRVAPVSGNYDSTTDIYGSLSKFAHRHHVAILACHHLVKKGSKDPFLGIHGSTGISGAADTLLALKRQRFNTDATLAITGKDVEETELAMRFDRHRGTWFVVGAASDLCVSDERQVLHDIIASHGQPMTLDDIQRALAKKGVDKEPGTTRVLLTRMVAVGEVSREGRGRYIANREKLPMLPLLQCRDEGSETIRNNGNNGNEAADRKDGTPAATIVEPNAPSPFSTSITSVADGDFAVKATTDLFQKIEPEMLIDQKIKSYLAHIPANDPMWRQYLKNANAPTVEAALAELLPAASKTARRAMESRLRRLRGKRSKVAEDEKEAVKEQAGNLFEATA